MVADMMASWPAGIMPAGSIVAVFLPGVNECSIVSSFSRPRCRVFSAPERSPHLVEELAVRSGGACPGRLLEGPRRVCAAHRRICRDRRIGICDASLPNMPRPAFDQVMARSSATRPMASSRSAEGPRSASARPSARPVGCRSSRWSRPIRAPKCRRAGGSGPARTRLAATAGRAARERDLRSRTDARPAAANVRGQRHERHGPCSGVRFMGRHQSARRDPGRGIDPTARRKPSAHRCRPARHRGSDRRALWRLARRRLPRDHVHRACDRAEPAPTFGPRSRARPCGAVALCRRLQPAGGAAPPWRRSSARSACPMPRSASTNSTSNSACRPDSRTSGWQGKASRGQWIRSRA